MSWAEGENMAYVLRVGWRPKPTVVEEAMVSSMLSAARVGGEAIEISKAVEELNRVSGRDHVWSYTTNHHVGSSPYYYVLWECNRELPRTAKLRCMGPKGLMLKYIEEFKQEKPQ